MRGPVIARLTSFGSDGARAAGLLFGVLSTMRLAGLNLYAFVLDRLGACARNGGQAPQDLDPWLPWRMSESRPQELSQPPARWWPQPPNPPTACAATSLAELRYACAAVSSLGLQRPGF